MVSGYGRELNAHLECGLTEISSQTHDMIFHFLNAERQAKEQLVPFFESLV